MAVYALVDCNNFYVSCERLFRPDLEGKPCIVLSNNDGCAVARSQEAKRLGVTMGAPRFQIEELIEAHGIVTFSSNYTLYADISNRVMFTLEALAPDVFIYSIDEAFLNLTGIENYQSLDTFGRQVRHRVHRDVGIPVCVGISTTKTLAKLANYAAKKYAATGGVVDLTERARQRKLLALVPVDEVWGVGRKLSQRLQSIGIHTALDLADADPKWIRNQFSVVLERTLRELNGEACLPFDDAPAEQKQIVVSRSFGEKLTEIGDIRPALASFVAKASEKLRRNHQTTGLIQVFLRTSPFLRLEPQYSNSLSHRLTRPSDDTRTLMTAAMRMLEQIWKPGFRYAKAGVLMTDLYDKSISQPSLFDDNEDVVRSDALMGAIDQINRSQRSGVFFASQNIQPRWSMRREHLSPAYTTRWSDLRKVR